MIATMVASTVVHWFGQPPAHWTVAPNRAVFREVGPRGFSEEPMLSVTIQGGVIEQSALLKDSSKKDQSNLDRSAYRLVEPGDLAYNKMRAWQGALGVSSHRGIVSPAYVIMRPRFDVDANYYHYLFRTPAFAKEAERWSYGITSDQWSLRAEDFKQIYTLVPPLDEQRAIARFLDRKSRRIARFIHARQRMIALLNEQKQAIIHQAVTRGLDPDVPLKPSGIDWLGDIPAHWSRLPLSRVTLARCDGPFGSGLKSSHYTESGVRVVRLQNIDTASYRHSSDAFISLAHYQTLGDHDVYVGDLLIAGLGDERHPCGRACVAPEGIEPAMVKADCFRFRPDRSKIDSEFAALQLSATAQAMSSVMSTGATRERVNLQNMASRPMALPSLQEQRWIVEHVAAAQAGFDEARLKQDREIELLREYRTRLIADVVTGKLDIRDHPDSAEVAPDDLDDTEVLDTVIADDEPDDDLVEEAPG